MSSEIVRSFGVAVLYVGGSFFAMLPHTAHLDFIEDTLGLSSVGHVAHVSLGVVLLLSSVALAQFDSPEF